MDDFWANKVNTDTAEYLGRAVMDAIRFRAEASALATENEALRSEVTQMRMSAQAPTSPAPSPRNRRAK